MNQRPRPALRSAGLTRSGSPVLTRTPGRASSGWTASGPVLSLSLSLSLGLALSGCGMLDEVGPSAAPPTPPAPIETATGGTIPLEDAIQRANLLVKDGLVDAARVEFEKIILSNPTIAAPYLGAGDIYRKKGDYKTAEERYAKAAEVEPSNFEAQYNHGLTLQLMDRLNEAVRSYLRALSIRPDDFYANLNLGTAYLQMSEPAQALPFAEKAVRIDGKSAAARTNLGAVYAAVDKHAAAIVEYQQAAELTELSAPLLLNLAESLGKVQRYEEMVATLEQLVRTQPSAAAYERLGSGKFRLRKYNDAEETFRKALDIDPNHYPALNGVGVCLLNKYVWSGSKDEVARDESFKMLRRSLAVESRQPRIVDLLSKYR